MGSHDFIKFPPCLEGVSGAPRIWFLCGQIQALIQQLQQTPIPPSQMNGLRNLYIAKGVHGTTAIEGNTLSEEEVGNIIAFDHTMPPSLEYQEREVRNIVTALETVGSQVLQGNVNEFSPKLLNGYHRLLLENLDGVVEEGVLIGSLRTHSVTVATYRGAPAEDCEDLVEKYCRWLNGNPELPDGKHDYDLASQIVKALVAHVYFAWIHPYGDGNGRMARLIEFEILLRAGVPDIAAHLLSNFYYKTLERYRSELQASHGEYLDGGYRDDGDLVAFIEYALEGYRDELKQQCLEIHNHQIGVIWHDYIHSMFPRKLKGIEERQKRLALELTDPQFQAGLTFREVSEATRAIELTYTGKDRTLRRDLDKLLDMKLLMLTNDKYRPNIEIMFTFFANARPDSE